MEKYYQFSGIGLAVELPRDRMYEDDMQLAPFRREWAEDAHRYHISVVDQLELPAWKETARVPGAWIYETEGGYIRCAGSVSSDVSYAHIRTEHRGKEHWITVAQRMVSGQISPRLVLNALDVEHLVSQSGGVILHASYIDWEGRGILFTAPCGTGKSTQAELWKTYRNADIINGDRAVVIPRDGQIWAGGLPFSGSSQYCKDRTIPLAAIVYLKQAPATTIRPLSGLEAFRKIWEGCCVNKWNRRDMETAMNLLEQVMHRVPVLELACTPDESAVIALEQQLRKDLKA